MKKKYLIILIGFLLISLTGCDGSNKMEISESKHTNEIELYDKELGFKTTFTYDDNVVYSDIEIDEEKENDGSSVALEFDSDDLDIEFDMYYITLKNEVYNQNLKKHSNDKNYQEYRFGEYDAYSFGNNDDELELYVVLSLDTSTGDYNTLHVLVRRLDDDEKIIVKDAFDSKQIQALFNTLKFGYVKKEKKS